MIANILLIIIPLAIMGMSFYVFIKGYFHAKQADKGYTILSALDAPVADEVEVPAALEAKQLILEYAEALNGRYEDHHKVRHTLNWVEKLDNHVQRNKSYYQKEVNNDRPVEQLAEKESNIVSIFANKR